MGFSHERKGSNGSLSVKGSVSSSVSSDKIPAEHDLLAERPGQGSNLSGVMNIVCVVAGTGTLGLPYCLAQGKKKEVKNERKQQKKKK